MKIAILSIYQNEVSRGAETYVRELVKHLSRHHQIEVLSSNATPRSNWPIIWRLFLDIKSLQILFFTIKKAPYLWRRKFDIVIPTNGGWQSAIVRLLTWFCRGKMIIVGLSGPGWDDRNNLWCFPDYFVAISEKALEWARKANPFVRSSYIPIGVDTNVFIPTGKKKILGLKRPIVLCVASYTKTKRIPLAVNAVSKLKKVSLAITGSGGELREETEKLGKQLLGKKFKIIEATYHDMPSIYRSCDILTVSSESIHSFEIVLLEAMASGLAVVANNDPIRKSIIGNAGILVDPTDSRAYSKAIKEALLRNWGKIPRHQAEKFSWDKIAKKYEKLFKELTQE